MFYDFFVDMHICTQIGVKIYAYGICFSHTQYNLCIVPQQKHPKPVPANPPPQIPKQHPALYKVNMYSTHTL